MANQVSCLTLSRRASCLLCNSQHATRQSGVSSIANRYFSSSSNNKTRLQRKGRKVKSLGSRHPSPRTTRDQIRLLQDANVWDRGNRRAALMEHKVDELGDRAEEGLNFFRNKMYSFWRPPEQLVDAEGTVVAERPARKVPDLKMDAKWWFWNIVMALSPALLMVAYCELVAKPQMLEHQRRTELRKQKREGIINNNNPEQGNIGEALDVFSVVSAQSDDQSISTRIYSMARDLAAYVTDGEQQSQPDDEPGTAQVSKPNKHSVEIRSAEPQMPSQKSTLGASSTERINDDGGDDDETVQALKQRIEALERLVGLQHSRHEPVPPIRPQENTRYTPPQRSHIRDRVLQKQTAKAQKENEAAAVKDDNSAAIQKLQGYWCTIKQGMASLGIVDGDCDIPEERKSDDKNDTEAVAGNVKRGVSGPPQKTLTSHNAEIKEMGTSTRSSPPNSKQVHVEEVRNLESVNDANNNNAEKSLLTDADEGQKGWWRHFWWKPKN